MSDRKKTLIFIIAVSVIGLLACAASLYQFTLGDGCIFLSLTGLPCPTCGMTRATFCMISLRFTEAFGYHPLFWAPYIMAFLGVLCIPLKRWRKRLLYCIIALVAAFIAVWIARIAFFGWRG